MKKQLLAAASIASIALAGLAFAAPAQAVDCANGTLFVNTQTQLLQYNAAGEQVGTPVTFSTDTGYGDIAITQDLSTVYGVFNDEPWADPNVDPLTGYPNGDVIEIVNATTGAVTGTILITGAAAGQGSWVGAAMLPSGELVIGGNTPKVYKVNVTTGASTEWVDLSVADPAIAYNMGDFARLPDGDEIAIGFTGGANATLVRIHEDGTMNVAGTIPNAWGAGRVGNTIMVSGDAMHSFQISDIPASGTSEIPSVQLNPFSDAWGAAGSQDATVESCDATLPNTGVDAGALGALGLGLGLAGAAGVVIARRKTA